MTTDVLLYLYRNSDALRSFLFTRYRLTEYEFQFLTFISPNYARLLIIKALAHVSSEVCCSSDTVFIP